MKWLKAKARGRHPTNSHPAFRGAGQQITHGPAPNCLSSAPHARLADAVPSPTRAQPRASESTEWRRKPPETNQGKSAGLPARDPRGSQPAAGRGMGPCGGSCGRQPFLLPAESVSCYSPATCRKLPQTAALSALREAERAHDGLELSGWLRRRAGRFDARRVSHRLRPTCDGRERCPHQPGGSYATPAKVRNCRHVEAGATEVLRDRTGSEPAPRASSVSTSISAATVAIGAAPCSGRLSSPTSVQAKRCHSTNARTRRSAQ